jgi:hypothetical protein
MKLYVGMDVCFLDFGTSWGSGQLHAPAALTPPPSTSWIREWVGPRVGLDDDGEVKNLEPIGTPTPRSSVM